jgi:hypothetical protein
VPPPGSSSRIFRASNKADEAGGRAPEGVRFGYRCALPHGGRTSGGQGASLERMSLDEQKYRPDLSVVVPVYRNAGTLSELYRRLRDVLEAQQLAFELLFVDDACPAGSLSVLEALARSDSRVAVLALALNVGQSGAVMAGLARALGQWVVVLDADLQDPPEAIPALLAELRKGSAAVFAGRHGGYGSLTRHLGSRVYKQLLHYLTGLPVDASMFMAMERRMVERLLAFGVRRPFVVAMMGCSGLPLASIPVQRSSRPVDRSAYSFWKLLKLGCSALALALACKWRPLFGFVRGEPPAVAVKAYFGSRFTRGGGPVVK